MTSPRLAVAFAAAALSVLGFSGAVAAGSAWADTTQGTVGGLTYVWDQNVSFGPGADASVDARCPRGTHVLGGGAQVGSGGAASKEFIWINTSQPIDWHDSDTSPDDGWRADVWDGSGSSASLLVWAICAEERPVYRTDTATATVGHAGVAKARCTRHTRLASGGNFIGGGVNEAHLNSSYPVDGRDSDSKPDDGWKARGYNRTGVQKAVDAYAICARTGHFRYVSPGSFTLPPTPGTGVDLACPGSSHATGGGMQITGLPGEAHIFGVVPVDDSGTDADVVPDDRWLYTVFNTGTDKSYTWFAICRT